MRTLALAVVFSLVVSGMTAPALAAPCKDAKGKFTKCPPAPAAGVRCRANGKFAKCGTPGAVPVK